MARNADDLIVGIGADLKSLERELKKAGVITGKAVDDIEDRFARANPNMAWASTIGNVLGRFISDAAYGVVEALKQANAELIKLGDLSERTGISLAQLARFGEVSNGLGFKDVNAQLVIMDTALRESQNEANNLTRFFNQNKISLKDTNGELINAQEALIRIADVFKSGDVLGREKMAEYLGLSKDLIPVLTQGTDELRNQSKQITQNELEIQNAVEAAKQLQERWDAISAIIFNSVTPALQGVLSLIETMIKGAERVGTAWEKISGLMQIAAGGGPPGVALGPNDRIGNELQDYPRMGEGIYRAGRIGGTPRKPWEGPEKPKSGGGNRLSDADRDYNRIVDYILQLEKAGRILQAEVDSIGKSNAERMKAIELARIGTVTDEEQLRLIGEQVTKNEELRKKLKEVKDARQGVFDAASFAGNQFLDVLDGLIDGTKSLEESLQGVIRALIKAALQAAILGSGPLAGLFGTKGVDGAPGGLVGAALGAFLPGRASGGPVNKNRPYMVGERGRELFVPQTPGRIIPNSAMRGGGMTFSPSYSIDARGSQMGEAQFRAILAENNRVMIRNLPQAFAAQQRRFV